MGSARERAEPSPRGNTAAGDQGEDRGRRLTGQRLPLLLVSWIRMR